jgi:hypothetical protein
MVSPLLRASRSPPLPFDTDQAAFAGLGSWVDGGLFSDTCLRSNGTTTISSCRCPAKEPVPGQAVCMH